MQARARLRMAWSNCSRRCVLVAIAFSLCTFISSPAFSAVVLQYHHVSDDMPESTSIAPRLFAQHLQLIETLKLSVWSLPRLVAALRSKETIPDNVVVITFDDAYDSIYKHAYPELRKRSWPFTVFVATDPIEKAIVGFMSWQQLKEMRSHGATIANHTRSHTHLVRQKNGETNRDWIARVKQELEGAQQLIEAKTGQNGRYFAYPYGETLPEIERLVLEMNFVGFGQHSGPLDSRYRLSNLPRFPMNNRYGQLDELKTKLQSLPMPILSTIPQARIISPSDMGSGIELLLDVTGSELNLLNCFLSGHGKLKTSVSPVGNHVRIRSEGVADLIPGRNRINCTLPAKDSRPVRYYWASHVWMTKTREQQWYEEP